MMSKQSSRLIKRIGLKHGRKSVSRTKTQELILEQVDYYPCFASITLLSIEATTLIGWSSGRQRKKISGWPSHQSTSLLVSCPSYTWMKERICLLVIIIGPLGYNSSYSRNCSVSLSWLSSSSNLSPSCIYSSTGASRQRTFRKVNCRQTSSQWSTMSWPWWAKFSQIIVLRAAGIWPIDLRRGLERSCHLHIDELMEAKIARKWNTLTKLLYGSNSCSLILRYSDNPTGRLQKLSRNTTKSERGKSELKVRIDTAYHTPDYAS